MTRGMPDGVAVFKNDQYTEFFVNTRGLKNLVAIAQDEIHFSVPPLVKSSFAELAHAGWYMKVRHHKLHTAKGIHLKRARVQFYEPNTNHSMSLRIERRGLYTSIWDVVDDIQNHEFMSMSEYRQMPSAVTPSRTVDELEMLKQFNELRYAELVKLPRKPKPMIDLTNVVNLDDYLKACQEKPADTEELDQRVAQALTA